MAGPAGLSFTPQPTCRIPVRPGWSSHHGMGRGWRLHPAPTHPPAAAGTPRGHRYLPWPPAGPPGLHAAAAPAAWAVGEPRPCPRSPLWLLAARGGLVCQRHRDASGEEVQQRPLRRYGWLCAPGRPCRVLPPDQTPSQFLVLPFPLPGLASIWSTCPHIWLLGMIPCLCVSCPYPFSSLHWGCLSSRAVACECVAQHGWTLRMELDIGFEGPETTARGARQPHGSDLSLSGLIGSAFSVLQFLSAPLTGATSDCLGRRPMMLLSLTGVATSYAVWATSGSFAAFLASRLIGGISKGNVSLSTAIIADLSSPLARSQGMAVIGVAFSLGFTLGPMLGASLPVEMAPWFALLFAASDLLFIFCFLPETLPVEKRAPSIALGFRGAADLLSPLALLHFSAVAHGQNPPAGDRLSSLRRLGLVYFIYLFLFSGLEYTLSFLTHQRFQFSSLQQGKMFFLIGLTMATIQGAYARRIHPGGEVAAVKRALLLLVPAFLLIGWGHSLPMLGLGLLLYSFGSPGQKGTVMGTLRSLGALARAAGPLVAASVYWLAGAQACFTVWSGLFLLPFLLLRKLSCPAQMLKAE
ncbi:major facilitator superfamily domain-containing protein 10 isoform X6 [Callithrix jacchus]|uniref:major facilitator superfamily domain-containing protein 10 isoform X2 n=1 Tax=Callithrix jacchus TaxID=9483 RepID=UPI00159E9F02|nr:major facilitator superfamily domain-containing protein 10 isoform X2 [Callithrix jacchus]